MPITSKIILGLKLYENIPAQAMTSKQETNTQIVCRKKLNIIFLLRSAHVNAERDAGKLNSSNRVGIAIIPCWLLTY